MPQLFFHHYVIMKKAAFSSSQGTFCSTFGTVAMVVLTSCVAGFGRICGRLVWFFGFAVGYYGYA